jgi:chitodextrinase
MSGTPQSYVMLNLTPGTAYYFAIKARDASNNWSNLSNVPSAATTATDQAPPSSVKDLGAGP